MRTIKDRLRPPIPQGLAVTLYWRKPQILVGGFITAFVFLIAGPGEVAPAAAQSPIGQDTGVQGPFVSDPVTPGTSYEVRNLPTEHAAKSSQTARPVNDLWRANFQQSEIDGKLSAKDPLLDNSVGGQSKTPSAILNFEGISAAGFRPADPVGDVGPKHYIQMVNRSFAIFDKTTVKVAGPFSINSLWIGQNNECEFNNHGDPIVLYDHLANQWLLSQVAVPFGAAGLHICIAISQTSDPLGAYYLYDFPVLDVPDYPKFGVWPDAYYVTTNNSPPWVTAFAFDRASMLSGASATFQSFQVQRNFMLPSDLDGGRPPDKGSPNHFYTFMDDAFWPANFGIGTGEPDRLEIWAFHVDFSTPGNSVFTRTLNIPISSFEYTVCGFGQRDCIPQPSPGQKLDSISEWPMWRLQYRNFGPYETLVGNFTVEVDGTSHAGIRWFELRKNDGGIWSLYQEGTHAPDTDHRWMGSIAMDRQGNLALGYSVSGNALFPSLRYATRLASDPLGVLANEVTLIAGTGAQTNADHRWGDYSSMNVDPVDGCTFWYTGEYYGTTSEKGWQTRIGAFRIPTCGNTYLPIVVK